MKTIQIANINILVSFHHEDEFKSLKKYETIGDAKYKIITDTNINISIPNVKPIETEFYDLYVNDDYTIQVQHDTNKTTGYIIYKGNEVIISPLYDSFLMEYLLSQYAICYIMALNDALILHGSSFIYNNMGIILSAKSGTGKSTHSRLWQKYEDITIINDDKNILKIENDEIICYGSPWSGKHMLDNNVSKKLESVVFLYQNKENVIERLSIVEAFKKLMGQLVLPTKENQDLWNKIMDKLLALPIYNLGCNMDKEAYLTLKKELDLLCH